MGQNGVYPVLSSTCTRKKTLTLCNFLKVSFIPLCYPIVWFKEYVSIDYLYFTFNEWLKSGFLNNILYKRITPYFRDSKILILLLLYANMELGLINTRSTENSCRMCTQFPECFLILAQYLLLAKKASNFKKKKSKFKKFKFIMYNV